LFELIKEYGQNPQNFYPTYTRKKVSKITLKAEAFIQEKLTKEYALINNPDTTYC
jgi:hypothetical protein